MLECVDAIIDSTEAVININRQFFGIIITDFGSSNNRGVCSA